MGSSEATTLRGWLSPLRGSPPICNQAAQIPVAHEGTWDNTGQSESPSLSTSLRVHHGPPRESYTVRRRRCCPPQPSIIVHSIGRLRPRHHRCRCRIKHVATKRRRKASHSRSRLHQVDANRDAASRNWANQEQIGGNLLRPWLSNLRSLDKVTQKGNRLINKRQTDNLIESSSAILTSSPSSLRARSIFGT